ncbi:MAG: hypothetical protein K9N51_10805, partial [Candidatus Pacebacteria bacterium]|nr:hypothetical protein [Candidatus Paceibacterota bacterium]
MSIPSHLHRDEHISAVRHDPERDEIHVRLELSTVYPDKLGVAHYSRELMLTPRGLTCRDHVVLDQPRMLSWLFQGKPDFGITLQDNMGVFGNDCPLHLHPVPVGFDLTASLHPTEVVWSYASASGFKPFAHVRYDTTNPVKTAIVDFRFSAAKSCSHVGTHAENELRQDCQTN